MHGRPSAVPRCAHGGTVPVESIEGEVVARLCTNPECSKQLAADFRPSLVDLFFDPNLIEKPRRRRWW